jgi:hypothetical protein
MVGIGKGGLNDRIILHSVISTRGCTLNGTRFHGLQDPTLKINNWELHFGHYVPGTGEDDFILLVSWERKYQRHSSHHPIDFIIERFIKAVSASQNIPYQVRSKVILVQILGEAAKLPRLDCQLPRSHIKFLGPLQPLPLSCIGWSLPVDTCSEVIDNDRIG